MINLTENCRIIRVQETTSTNDLAKEQLRLSSVEMAIVLTDFQTAGRGQTGNHWESEKGKNLLYSIGVRPVFLPARMQFKLLQVASLAVWESVNRLVPDVSIKWPNDIYFGEQKLSGTLIENRLRGNLLAESVLGTGLNVNQMVFSDYPANPVSLRQILGRPVDRETLFQNIVDCFKNRYRQLSDHGSMEINRLYQEHLFRRNGIYPFRDKSGVFKAEIVGLEDDGHLLLRDTDNLTRRYAFKEVKHILSDLECE